MELTVEQSSGVPIRPKDANEERSCRTDEVTKENAKGDSSVRVDESAYSNTNILVWHEIPDENKDPLFTFTATQNPPLQLHHNRSPEWWAEHKKRSEQALKMSMPDDHDLELDHNENSTDLDLEGCCKEDSSSKINSNSEILPPLIK